mmetsp:Transcript_10506/g.22455  ORF Transcript_10506/g.22455 Transcript_10506/m.22455 type:complete len:415 (-) Transcript_10506:834-2078(-)
MGSVASPIVKCCLQVWNFRSILVCLGSNHSSSPVCSACCGNQKKMPCHSHHLRSDSCAMGNNCAPYNYVFCNCYSIDSDRNAYLGRCCCCQCSQWHGYLCSIFPYSSCSSTFHDVRRASCYFRLKLAASCYHLRGYADFSVENLRWTWCGSGLGKSHDRLREEPRFGQSRRHIPDHVVDQWPHLRHLQHRRQLRHRLRRQLLLAKRHRRAAVRDVQGLPHRRHRVVLDPLHHGDHPRARSTRHGSAHHQDRGGPGPRAAGRGRPHPGRGRRVSHPVPAVHGRDRHRLRRANRIVLHLRLRCLQALPAPPRDREADSPRLSDRRPGLVHPLGRARRDPVRAQDRAGLDLRRHGKLHRLSGVPRRVRADVEAVQRAGRCLGLLDRPGALHARLVPGCTDFQAGQGEQGRQCRHARR